MICFVRESPDGYPQARLQAWYASLPDGDQPAFDSAFYQEVTALGDVLVSILSPHYSDDDITQLFLSEPYPTPLPPVPPLSARTTTKPLFLPDSESATPPPLASSAPPSALPRQRKTRDLVTLPEDPPPPGSLAAELLADASHHAADREREARQLDELIKNNTDPDGRGRHASAKEKRAATSAAGEFLVPRSSFLFIASFSSSSSVSRGHLDSP